MLVEAPSLHASPYRAKIQSRRTCQQSRHGQLGVLLFRKWLATVPFRLGYGLYFGLGWQRAFLVNALVNILVNIVKLLLIPLVLSSAAIAQCALRISF